MAPGVDAPVGECPRRFCPGIRSARPLPAKQCNRVFTVPAAGPRAKGRYPHEAYADARAGAGDRSIVGCEPDQSIWLQAARACLPVPVQPLAHESHRRVSLAQLPWRGAAVLRGHPADRDCRTGVCRQKVNAFPTAGAAVCRLQWPVRLPQSAGLIAFAHADCRTLADPSRPLGCFKS